MDLEINDSKHIFPFTTGFTTEYCISDYWYLNKGYNKIRLVFAMLFTNVCIVDGIQNFVLYADVTSPITS